MRPKQKETLQNANRSQTTLVTTRLLRRTWEIHTARDESKHLTLHGTMGREL
jgi:hypothetical protein